MKRYVLVVLALAVGGFGLYTTKLSATTGEALLVPGTAVRILEETKEWFRIQFTDPQFGPRVGYVLRKFVQIGKS